MKKFFLIIGIMILLLSGCVFRNNDSQLTIYALKSSGGTRISGVKTEVFSGSRKIFEGFTDEEGKVTFNPDIKDYVLCDIVMTKSGCCYNKVYGLRIKRDVKISYEAIMHESQLVSEPAPDKSLNPDIKLLYNNKPVDLSCTLSSNDILSYEINVDESFSDFRTKSIYVDAGLKIPGSSFFSPDRIIYGETNHAAGNINLSVYEDITPVHFIFYDENDNRIHKIFYLNIQRNNISEDASTAEITRIQAVTRKHELKLYSVRSGDDGKNMWVDIEWKPVKSDGYVVYRSLDDEKYEETGRVNKYTCKFKDNSTLIQPGKKIYYKIGVLSGNMVKSYTEPKYTIPLDTFSPVFGLYEDGKLFEEVKKKGVSNSPVFFFRPDRELYFEGKIKYNFIPCLKDTLSNSGYNYVPYYTDGFSGTFVVNYSEDNKYGDGVKNLLYNFAEKNNGTVYLDRNTGNKTNTPYVLETVHPYEYGFMAVWAQTGNAISIVYDETGIFDPFGSVDPAEFKILITK